MPFINAENLSEMLAAAWDEGWERSAEFGYPSNHTPGYYDNPYRAAKEVTDEDAEQTLAELSERQAKPSGLEGVL